MAYPKHGPEYHERLLEAVTAEEAMAVGIGGVPYEIADGVSFLVPAGIQMLFAETIDGEGLLVVEGMLIEVD